MGRYTKGIMDGAKPFENIYDAKAKEMSEKYKDVKGAMEDTQEVVMAVLDLLELPEGERKEFMKSVKKKWSKKKFEPPKYDIKIVFKKEEDQEMVDNLRSAMSSSGHSVSLKEYSDYSRQTYGKADYIFFIDKPEKEIVDWEDADRIYSAYGCEIIKTDINSCKNVLLTYDENYDFDECREDFIQYYRNQLKKIKRESKEAKKAAKALEERKERERKKQIGKKEGRLGKHMDSVFNSLDKMADKMLDWPAMFQVGAAISVLALAGISMLVVQLAETMEEVAESLKDLSDKIADSNFDKRFVAEAQRQILAIKMIEFMERQCLENA